MYKLMLECLNAGIPPLRSGETEWKFIDPVAMEKQEGSNMDKSLITVDSKWLATKDAEFHRAGEILTVKEAGNSWGSGGRFTTCGDHTHGISLFLSSNWAAAVPLRDEAFWKRYEPQRPLSGLVNPSPKLGEIAVWCRGEAGVDRNFSVWVGIGGNTCVALYERYDGSDTIIKPGTGRSITGTGPGHWQLIQALGQLEPTAPEEMGYEPTANRQPIAMPAVVEVQRQPARLIEITMPAVCAAGGCYLKAATPKAALCEQHIYKRQLAADVQRSQGQVAHLLVSRPAPHYGERPQSHATMAGGFFTLTPPKTKKAWAYPSLDDFDLLPDA